MSDRKKFDAHVKSVDLAKGLVTSVVSVFGNIDAQRDVVLSGAFTRSIAKWKARMASGQFLPVVYGHKDDPDFTVGKVVDLRQTDEGLEVDEQYFLDKPKARSAFDNIRNGVLPGSSFAYDVISAKSNSHGGLDLAELDLIEVGPTTYPSNDATRLVGVKDATAEPDAEVHIPLNDVGYAFVTTLRRVIDEKAGRRLSASSQQRIRDAIAAHEQGIAALTALLDEHAVEADDAGKADEPDEVKADDPPVKAEVRALMAAAFAATG